MELQTAAVFGGSGKIGRRVIRYFEEHAIAVSALVHRTPIGSSTTRIHTGDISDMQTVRETVSGADVVVHLATAKEDPDTFFDVSIKGTFNVLEACREEGVKQLILVSGDAAQGIWFYPHPRPINENTPKAAYPGYYAFSKVIEEVMAEQYVIQYDLPVTILRSSWVFDEDDILHHFSLLENVDPAEKGHGFGEVTADIMALVEAGEERIPIQTDAAGVPYYRHIVHIDDVMQGFELMVGNSTAIAQDFNIAAPAPFEYRVAAEYVSEKLGIPTVEVRCPGYHSFAIDTSKAQSMLGYAPQVDFFGIVDRAIAWRSSK